MTLLVMIGAYGRHVEERYFIQYGEPHVKKESNSVLWGARCVSCGCLDYTIRIYIL